MIPSKSAVIERTGSLGGEKISGHVNEEGLILLMGVATNLYGDKIAACVREYSTNALDSHLMSGQTRPIEITLPTPLSPTFIVRDYGLGMDADDIRNTYSGYGNSTKRDVADANGVLGIGSKAALSHTHSFTVIGWKNGKRTSVLVSRGESGVLEAEIVSVVDSDEPTGVEIKISSNNENYRFESASEKFFSFWKPGLALVDGKDLSNINKAEQLSEHCYYHESLERNSLLMGGVVYPISVEYFHSADRLVRPVLVVVDITDPEYAVDFAPTREALNYSQHTKGVLGKIQEELFTSIENEAQELAKNCQNYIQRFKLAGKLANELRLTIRYTSEFLNGIGTEKAPPFFLSSADADIIQWRPSEGRYAVTCGIKAIGNSQALSDSTVFISEYPKKSGVPYADKLKIRQFLSDAEKMSVHLTPSSVVYLIPEGMEKYTEYPEEFRVFEWSEIIKWAAEQRKKDAISNPPAARAPRKKNGVYLSLNHGGEVDMTDCHVVYGKKKEIINFYRRAKDFYKDDRLHFVVVSVQQHDKLKRTVRKATPAKEFIDTFNKDFAKAELSEITNDQYIRLALNEYDHFELQAVAKMLEGLESAINDPSLSNVVRVAKNDIVYPSLSTRNSSEYRNGITKAIDPSWKELGNVYPLVVGYSWKRHKITRQEKLHLIEYINMMYQRKKENKDV